MKNQVRGYSYIHISVNLLTGTRRMPYREKKYRVRKTKEEINAAESFLLHIWTKIKNQVCICLFFYLLINLFTETTRILYSVSRYCLLYSPRDEYSNLHQQKCLLSIRVQCMIYIIFILSQGYSVMRKGRVEELKLNLQKSEGDKKKAR